jgi:hypothetical protein
MDVYVKNVSVSDAVLTSHLFATDRGKLTVDDLTLTRLSLPPERELQLQMQGAEEPVLHSLLASTVHLSIDTLSVVDMHAYIGIALMDRVDGQPTTAPQVTFRNIRMENVSCFTALVVRGLAGNMSFSDASFVHVVVEHYAVFVQVQELQVAHVSFDRVEVRDFTTHSKRSIEGTYVVCVIGGTSTFFSDGEMEKIATPPFPSTAPSIASSAATSLPTSLNASWCPTARRGRGWGAFFRSHALAKSVASHQSRTSVSLHSCSFEAVVLRQSAVGLIAVEHSLVTNCTWRGGRAINEGATALVVSQSPAVITHSLFQGSYGSVAAWIRAEDSRTILLDHVDFIGTAKPSPRRTPITCRTSSDAVEHETPPDWRMSCKTAVHPFMTNGCP